MPDKHILTRDGKWVTISDDELYHWKYIKREKKNGKWVYTYPDDKLGLKNFIDTKITGNAYKQHIEEANKEKSETALKLLNATYNKTQASQTSRERASLPSYMDPKTIHYSLEEKKLQKEYKRLDKEIDKINYNYNKSVKAKVEEKTADIKDSVNRAKDKLDKAASKGKNFVDNLFAKKKKNK